MEKRKPVVAVFDIGKTNKKLLLFDEEYNVVKEEIAFFDEIVDDDGFPCEDIDALTGWLLAKWAELKQSSGFRVKAVNFSTYGASLVHTNAEGKRIGYLYNYLKPYPEALLQEFLRKRGGSASFSETTSTPIMGHLNAGLQLYWLKHAKSEIFKKIRSSFHLPQYLSFLITGKRAAEMTNLGCHSAMWNFSDGNYQAWLEEEGIQEKLAPVIKGDTVTECLNEFRNEIVQVGVGLHDSSAATIPYLSSFKTPFVILSTGTWVISLNPFNSELPTADELEKGCLSYLTYQGNPVKTTMLFAGNDHDQQVKSIAEHFHIAPDFFKSISFDEAILFTLKNREDDFSANSTFHLISATTPCKFHLRNLTAFQSPREAYHQLLCDMIEQQISSTAMVLKDSPVKNIYVDGGFCRNNIYMQLLANAFPGKNVFATSMIQGTALGAALAIHHSWNDRPLPQSLITLNEWKAI